MKTQSILIRLPGYPLSLKALMPDRDLASVAGSLLADGHDTVIRDFGTVGLIDRLYPAEFQSTASRIVDRLFNGATARNPLILLHTLWQVRSADKAFAARQAQCCDELAATFADEGKVDFIAIKMDAPDDLRSGILLAKRIRQHSPGTTLLAFGEIASLYPTRLIEESDAFDCICVGDPELAITCLADNIHDRERWTDLPNLVFRNNEETCYTKREYIHDLDALPRPVYDDDVYRALRNNRKLKLFSIEESRGGSCQCAACSQILNGGNVRLRGTASVISQIESLAGRFGAHAFRIMGHGSPDSHIQATAHAITSRGLRLAYSRSTHETSIGTPAFAALKASGCVSMSFDIGSGSQRMLRDYFQKDASITGIGRMLNACHSHGINTLAHFTYPTPGDDRHTRGEIMRLIQHTRVDAAIIDMPRLLPGSQWYQQSWRYGYGVSAKDDLKKLLRCRTRFCLPEGRWNPLPYTLDGITANEAMELHESAIQELESMGIMACMLDETPIVSSFINTGKPLPEFRTRLMRHFLTGDVHGIARLVKEFNSQACETQAEDQRERLAMGD